MDRRQSASRALTVLIGVIFLLSLICVGTASLFGYTYTIDGSGLHAHNPQAQARATAQALEAIDAARARAVLLDTEQQAQPAAILGKSLSYVGAGIGVLIICVGLAFSFTAWINRRANTVYPDTKGQYPIIVKTGWGWVAYHDPNRDLGPAAVYRTPTILDQCARLLIAVKTGRTPQLTPLTADFPPTADSATMLQVASQAQAVGLMAAATRPQGLVTTARTPEDTLKLAQTVVNASPTTSGRMPPVRTITDPAQVNQVVQLFEEQDQ